MGKLGKNRRGLGVVLDTSTIDTIEKRAKALDLTPSRFGAMIVERWEAEGCPAVSEPDRLMQIAAKAEASPKGARKGAA